MTRLNDVLKLIRQSKVDPEHEILNPSKDKVEKFTFFALFDLLMEIDVI